MIIEQRNLYRLRAKLELTIFVGESLVKKISYLINPNNASLPSNFYIDRLKNELEQIKPEGFNPFHENNLEEIGKIISRSIKDLKLRNEEFKEKKDSFSDDEFQALKNETNLLYQRIIERHESLLEKIIVHQMSLLYANTISRVSTTRRKLKQLIDNIEQDSLLLEKLGSNWASIIEKIEKFLKVTEIHDKNLERDPLLENSLIFHGSVPVTNMQMWLIHLTQKYATYINNIVGELLGIENENSLSEKLVDFKEKWGVNDNSFLHRIEELENAERIITHDLPKMRQMLNQYEDNTLHNIGSSQADMVSPSTTTESRTIFTSSPSNPSIIPTIYSQANHSILFNNSGSVDKLQTEKTEKLILKEKENLEENAEENMEKNLVPSGQ